MPRIVVGLDGSPQADRALHWAVREAELRQAAIAVVHCYVLHAGGVVLHTPDRELAEDRLTEIIDRNRGVLDRVRWTSETMGVLGSPSVGLVDAAEDADLIVVGARGSGGFQRLQLGSTGYRTAAHSTAPVAVIHDEGDDSEDGRRPLVVGAAAIGLMAMALAAIVTEERTSARRLEPDALAVLIAYVAALGLVWFT